MGSSPRDRCGYTWPEGYTGSNIIRQQNCCYRESCQGSDYCIWHADPDEVEKKSIEELERVRTPPEVREMNSPYSELLTGAQIQGLRLRDEISFKDVSLRNSDLSNSKFYGADFSGSVLFQVNLTGASFSRGNLTDASLEQAILTDTRFDGANMTNARLDITTINSASFRNADLTNTSFQEAIFNEVSLRGATLIGTNMKHVSVNDVTLNQETDFSRQTRAEKEAESASSWDLIAQAYHEFKSAYSDQGFAGKARELHMWERRARSLEEKAASNRLNGWVNPTYLSSLLSRIFTGYGVRIRYLLSWMIGLFLFSTMWYTSVGVEQTLAGNFTYSVITFTTSPPDIPPGFWTQIVAMMETFFGTLSTVLLGYILGNRGRF